MTALTTLVWNPFTNNLDYVNPGGGGEGDINQIVTQDGTIIAVAGVVNLSGKSASEDDAEGIRVIAPVDGEQFGEVQLTNRLHGKVSTTNATPTSILSFSPTIIGSYTIECTISAYNVTSSLSAGYALFFNVNFDGTSSTVTDITDKIVNEQGAMSACNANAATSGAAILIQGTGYAAQNINWSAVALYTFVGA